MTKSVFIGFSVLYSETYHSAVISQLLSISVSQLKTLLWLRFGQLNLNCSASRSNAYPGHGESIFPEVEETIWLDC